MKTYDGPVSDHFDGTHFFDPDGAPPKSLGEVLRWQFGSDAACELAGLGAEPACRHAAAARRGGKVRLSFVGHASWLIQTAGLNILVDPVWSMRASPFSLAGPKRHNDPGIAFDALPQDRCRAGVARPLRPSRYRDAVEALGKIFAARDHAARQ